MNKKLSVLAVAGTVGLVGLGGAGVSALSSASSSSDSLVSKLADKFNLKEADVKAVFHEEKAARDAERQAEMSERLQKAVDDGDITAAQKTLIEDKRKLLEDSRDIQRDELEQWAQDNDIDERYLMGGMSMKSGHGGGRR